MKSGEAVAAAPISTLIVDDEPMARQIVRVLLSRDPEIHIAGECTGIDAPATIRRCRPELVFLDIHMPQVSGFDVIDQLDPEDAPVIVFVTAYDQYALRAFQVRAVDYLLKPFDDERFAAALTHAKQQVRARLSQTDRLASLLAELSGRGERQKERLLVRSGDRSVLIRTADIDWIEAADYYAEIHVGNASHLIREPLSELERRLDPARFFRIHRSAIVNIDRVVEILSHIKGDAIVVLRDGRELTLSRKRRDEFERLLGRIR
jgi:two-component system LytT family response regulator